MTRTVLVVDDDRAIQEMIQLTLESEGYHTLASIDGAALRTAHELKPDLILVDLWR